MGVLAGREGSPRVKILCLESAGWAKRDEDPIILPENSENGGQRMSFYFEARLLTFRVMGTPTGVPPGSVWICSTNFQELSSNL